MEFRNGRLPAEVVAPPATTARAATKASTPKSLSDLVGLSLLSIVLVASGLDKLFHYSGFVNALTSYEVLPYMIVPVVAPVVILMEIFLGVALWVPSWRRTACRTTALLLSLFTMALLIKVLDGDQSTCGCWFTLTTGTANWLHVGQNLVLIALATLQSREEVTPDNET